MSDKSCLTKSWLDPYRDQALSLKGVTRLACWLCSSIWNNITGLETFSLIFWSNWLEANFYPLVIAQWMAPLDLLFLLLQVFAYTIPQRAALQPLGLHFASWLSQTPASLERLFLKHLSIPLYTNFILNFWFSNVGNQSGRLYFRSSCSTSCRTYSCLNTFLFLLGPSCLSWAGLCLHGGSSESFMLSLPVLPT